jgi:polysaccharide export outer membrane protein
MFLLAGSSAAAGPTRAQPTEGWTGPFTVDAGDVLSVFVWKHPQLSAQVVVRPDGKLSYPLVGEMDGAGLTVKQIEGAITRELKKQVREPEVTVMLQTVNSFRIYVLGEVAKSGIFQLSGPVTVVQAIAMAGGFTPFASRSKIIIVNPLRSNQRLKFNYMSFVDGMEVNQNIVLRPGDTVLIP